MFPTAGTVGADLIRIWNSLPPMQGNELASLPLVEMKAKAVEMVNFLRTLKDSGLSIMDVLRAMDEISKGQQ